MDVDGVASQLCTAVRSATWLTVEVAETAGGSRSQHFKRLTTLERAAVGVSNEETVRRRASSPMTKNEVLGAAESVWSKEEKRGKQSIGI